MIPKDLEQRRSMISYMIDSCKYNDNLTEWETNFILSISDQFEMNGNLTDRQCEKLEQIYDKL
jgi:hypothetical protein